MEMCGERERGRLFFFFFFLVRVRSFLEEGRSQRKERGEKIKFREKEWLD
jgi:hypothetical protein